MENLGNYKQMPPTFQKLQKLQEDLEKEGYSLDSIGIIIDMEEQSFVTPCDSITFASNGQDGIHFGLLTDFGAVTDLEEAYVVYISPSDFGEAVFLAARNLREFMNLLFTMKDAIAISNFLSIEMKMPKEEDDEDDELLAERDYVLGKLKESFECTIIEDVKAYYLTLFEERKKKTVVDTIDGIGVIPMTNQPITSGKFEVDEDTVIEINDLKKYFQETSIENKLAFVRDTQALGIILDEEEVREFVLSELRELGYKIEAERLQISTEPYLL